MFILFKFHVVFRGFSYTRGYPPPQNDARNELYPMPLTLLWDSCTGKHHCPNRTLKLQKVDILCFIDRVKIDQYNVISIFSITYITIVYIYIYNYIQRVYKTVHTFLYHTYHPEWYCSKSHHLSSSLISCSNFPVKACLIHDDPSKGLGYY